MQYVAQESKSHPGEWVVETVSGEEIYMARFSGPQAEERAKEYAEWKNAKADSRVRLKDAEEEAIPGLVQVVATLIKETENMDDALMYAGVTAVEEGFTPAEIETEIRRQFAEKEE